jgi:hypothetical protein
VPQDGRDRLHHDLLGVEDAVHDDAEELAADLGDDDEPSCSPSAGLSSSRSSRFSETSGSSGPAGAAPPRP